ncbi:GNAT family N-acetyltransferase [Halostella sp. PRR32]|uniref:GNAT family N-acetyltransferase n=1 Tax=Halostella sp. PRR32 TaxID=3098147 RepID=UPI002B1E89E0|nr:GNAT family N-acetyltransferase [Halostella sp. PRR32]
MNQTAQRRDADDYVVRWYRECDRDGIRSLYETEWGWRPTREWFDWKYVDDPYLSHVPVTVAVRDGDVVGSQAYVPFPVRWRDGETLALQPADAVVHSDHRRNGLYTRMTREAIERYEPGEPSFFFNFPNPGALAAQQGMGWSAVDSVGTAYRVHDPTPLVSSDRPTSILASVAKPFARGYLELCDAVRETASSEPEGVTVETYESAPPSTLATVYESAVPEGIHVRRDAEFYRWWIGDPSFDHTAYVARRDGWPVAALVTRTRNGDKVKLLDALPLAVDRRDAFRALLRSWIDDDGDAAVLSVAESTLPRDLLLASGFVPDGVPLASRVCTQTDLAARPLSSDGETPPLPRSVLADENNWQITFAEQDRF